MSLSQAISAAMSGLRATQTGLSIVAGNVANVDTPGYVRKVPTQVPVASGDAGINVRVTGINRELDVYVQRQLRTETSGGTYAAVRADYYERLQKIYGEPGSDSALETVFNKFTAALQGLSASPDSPALRSSVLSAAQVLAQQLNGTSEAIQSLRTDAELALADATNQANEALKQIANINLQLGTPGVNDAASSVLMDQRDAYINQLSELMDIRVEPTTSNRIAVFTTSGIQLVGTDESQLTFDAYGALTPQSEWNSDPAKRTVGTLTLLSPHLAPTDLLVTRALRSGKIAAYLEMRDQILPQAQAQIDQIASAMASALSDRTVAGTAVPGPPAGFDVDVGSLLAGNTVNVTYTDTATNTEHRVTIVRVDDPALLPLADKTTPDPADRVVGIDFSGGMASVVAQLTTALGSTMLQFANPAGNILRVTDDGGTNRIDVNAVSATSTVTTLTGGSAELPFFLDAQDPYTGALTLIGPQRVGFSGRIAVNPALLGDPSRLIVYQTSPLTPAGDPTRPNFIFDQLTRTPLAFSPQAGIGTTGTPFSGSVASYLRQMISQQGQAAESAQSLKDGQDIVVKSLQQRFNDKSGVNVDNEMANLLQLQNAYAANARVMTIVRDLIDLLLKM